jgi:hypothetical protein
MPRPWTTWYASFLLCSARVVLAIQTAYARLFGGQAALLLANSYGVVPLPLASHLTSCTALDHGRASNKPHAFRLGQ